MASKPEWRKLLTNAIRNLRKCGLKNSEIRKMLEMKRDE